MNKKILIIGILIVLMLVTISFASAINTNTERNNTNKDSPLFKIRTKLAMKEKIGQIFENIKTKFLGERIFWIPLSWLKDTSDSENIPSVSQPCTKGNPGITCKGCKTYGC